MGRISYVTTVALLLAGCTSDPGRTDTGASPGTACEAAGGVCVGGSPGSSGFTITCPAGRLLDNRQPSTFGGGLDLINSSIGHGCQVAPSGGTYPAGCCWVAADAGDVDASDADAGAVDASDADAGAVDASDADVSAADASDASGD